MGVNWILILIIIFGIMVVMTMGGVSWLAFFMKKGNQQGGNKSVIFPALFLGVFLLLLIYLLSNKTHNLIQM